MVGDLWDMTELVVMLESGNLKAARRKASRLDTAVREEIPQKVFFWMFPDGY